MLVRREKEREDSWRSRFSSDFRKSGDLIECAVLRIGNGDTIDGDGA